MAYTQLDNNKLQANAYFPVGTLFQSLGENPLNSMVNFGMPTPVSKSGPSSRGQSASLGPSI